MVNLSLTRLLFLQKELVEATMTVTCVLQESGPSMSFEDARKVCKLRVARPKDFACVQLVYGHAGEMEAVYPDYRIQV